MIGDGAKGVPPGATLTVRDVRAFRVKVLNTAKLNRSLTAITERQQQELDAVGADEGDSRALFTRAVELLMTLAKDPTVRGSMRFRAAKTVAEALRDLRRDGVDSNGKKIELLQRSREHADKMRMEDRKVTVLETRMGGPADPYATMPIDELRKLRDASPEAE